MAASYSFACVLVLLAVLVEHQSAERVPCKDQQKVCECGDKQQECEFILRIEELQTFTSYKMDDSSGEFSRGTPGNVYYLNESGYHPASAPNQDTVDKRCIINNRRLVDDNDFSLDSNQLCSIPMTVDGDTYRRFIAINGRIPGPTLIVNKDALVRVRVENRLTSEGVTIHWHGMHQRGTPWMDGVGFVSQAPITSGAYFDYVFSATPSGTHWYHSHLGAQRTDGLFGALIVREKPSNYTSDIMRAIERAGPVPYEGFTDSPGIHTLTLLDWQREASLDLFVRIHSSLGYFPDTAIGTIPQANDTVYKPSQGIDGTEVGPIPYWSGLINGKGRRKNSTYSPLSVFPVAADNAYRFRIIGAQNTYAYSFSIDGHKLRVIAADGHFINPVEVDYIVVHSGERYDFILETFNKTEQNYWIRAETLEVNQTEEHSALAILKYGDGENTSFDWTGRYVDVMKIDRSCTESYNCRVLNCPFERFLPRENKTCVRLTSLFPLLQSSASTKPLFNPCDNRDNCTKFFNFGFEGISDTSAINGINFRLPVTPYQTNCGDYDKDDCNKCTTTNSIDCRCTHVTKIMENERFNKNRQDTAKTVIMVLSAVGVERLRGFSHPIHLHGHSFRVLHIGYGTYNDRNELNDTSPDVVCNDDKCLNPKWGRGREPSAVTEAAKNITAHILKDTVIVPAGGYVAFSFNADNPGYWLLHCHIEVHQLEGMAVVIEEYPSGQHRVPPAGINRVGNFRLEISDFESLSGKSCGAVGKTGGLSGLTIGLIVGLCVLGTLCLLLGILVLKQRCRKKHFGYTNLDHM